MKKSFIIAIIIAVLTALWLATGFFKGNEEGIGLVDGEKAVVEQVIPQVRVKTVEARPYVKKIRVTGRTVASQNVTLKAETQGTIETISVDEGSMVKAGTIIIKLSTDDREERIAEAKDRLQQRDIEYNASKSLENKGFNSKIRLAQSKADREQARAALKAAELDLENTEIKAPYDGIVFNQAVEIGDFVRVGDDITDIVDLDPIEVRGFITEKQRQDLKTGGDVTVNLISGKTIEGTLSYIAPAADENTRTFEVKVTAANGDMVVAEGLTAEILLPTAERIAHEISPSILSLNDKGVVGVKIVNKEDKVEFYPVEILADETESMWVQGLPEKADIITVGQEFVTQGQAVTKQQSKTDGLL